MKDVLIYGLGALATIGFVVCGMVYGDHKKLALWALFFPSVVIVVVAACLYWDQIISKEEQRSSASLSQKAPNNGPNHAPMVQHLPQPNESVVAPPKLPPEKEKPQTLAPRKVPESPRRALSAPEAQTFRERIENYTFSLGGGGVHVTYSVDALRAGPKDPFYLGGFSPVRVYLDDEKLFADCVVYAGPGLPPVEVKKNEFVVRPANWDRNFSSKALEIVDSQQNAVFQLIYKTASHIVVNGIFPFPGGLILAGESGMLVSPTLPTTFRLNRIFKYPSWKYSGQYEEPPK
jgi:hypothetical protein